MKKLLLASTAAALLAGTAYADDIKLGVSLGLTGPLESIAPAMQKGAELAVKEISDSGKLLDGSTVTPLVADNTCIDAAAAVAAVTRLVTADGVKGIVGGMCSGETIASLEQVGVPQGVVMISPSATSPVA
jgi:branched-chain amino acid transport system substrate-binding protein